MAEVMGGDLALKILQELPQLRSEVREGAQRTDRNLDRLTDLLGAMADETRRQHSNSPENTPVRED
ncbi:MAG TPA: hypothetical protein VEY30_07480 [Myxococcaceae bacterium]|nr:hypothetical protein [Myxococcaceae bacterium]